MSDSHPAAPEAAGPGAAIARQRSVLLAQCPLPPPSLSPEEAARHPIHVNRWGTTGPMVLVVHGGVQGGLGGGPRTFDKQKPLADKGWQLAVVDRPGFGQSASRGVDDMEADSVWIGDMLGDSAHLIGHSWGGAEALLAAARRPEAVRSLTLIEPALHPLLMVHPRAATDPAIKMAGAQIMKLMMEVRTPGEYGMAFARGMGTEGDGPNAVAAAFQNDPEQATRVGCALLQGRMAPPPVLQQAAATIARSGIPVLVISGGWSSSFDTVGTVVAEMTGGRYVVVQASKHFVQEASDL